MWQMCHARPLMPVDTTLVDIAADDASALAHTRTRRINQRSSHLIREI